MALRLLLDTDVLIDYFRGREEALAYLRARSEPILISVITVAELYAGVREGEERRRVEQFLAVLEIIPVDAEIAQKGGLYRRDYGPSHGIGLADALIAATAEFHQARLVTLNARHFPMVEVEVPYTKTM
ncbi:MAG: type II toxin-antitoxin system VapC family toxin [Deltaproteobacteria bacterium]|nr:type II toxin-antitoxin system VapC family toxin [Deltaproteobacteria bacterium]